GLSTSPDDRPRTMHEVLTELAPPVTPRRRSTRIVVALAGLVALAGIGVGAFFALRPPPRAVHRVLTADARPTVAVLDFRIVGAPEGDEWLGAWLARTVGAELSAGNGARLFSRDDAARAGITAQAGPLDGKVLARARSELGAAYVVAGTCEMQA